MILRLQLQLSSAHTVGPATCTAVWQRREMKEKAPAQASTGLLEKAGWGREAQRKGHPAGRSRRSGSGRRGHRSGRLCRGKGPVSCAAWLGCPVPEGPLGGQQSCGPQRSSDLLMLSRGTSEPFHRGAMDRVHFGKLTPEEVAPDDCHVSLRLSRSSPWSLSGNLDFGSKGVEF